jgi:hypothetical protein
LQEVGTPAEGTRKVGVCDHPEEAEIMRRLMAWLQAWKQAPEEPETHLPQSARRPLPKLQPKVDRNPSAFQEEDVVGAPKRKGRMEALLDAVSKRTHAHGPDTYLQESANKGRMDMLRALDLSGAKDALISSSIAPGTQKAYDGNWRRWEVFCAMRSQSPYMTPEGRREVRDAEENVLDLIVHLSQTMERTGKTVENYLYAIRSRHLHKGYANPLANMTRVWLAVKGLKRLKGATARKWPVTARMMERLSTRYDVGKADECVVWSATCTGWFFLLRASEYLKHDGQPVDRNKVLRGCDVSFHRNGRPCPLDEVPDEVVLRILGSKVDQLNQGEVRNHFKSAGEGFFCPVRALNRLRMHFPARFAEGPESLKPVFRYSNGAMLERSTVVKALEAVASEEGAPADRIGSHSLRIGGACALYYVFGDLDLVRRFGRWSSGTFHVYLWESRESTQNVARGMAGDRSTLMASRGLGAEQNRKGVTFTL